MHRRSSLHLSCSVDHHEVEPPGQSQPLKSPSTVPMLSLPSEIITAILQNADSRKDLKHIRLSCKCLAGIAVELLFREVTVVPHVDSFEQLLKLSEHALLRRHVKRLAYDTRTISAPADLELHIDADPLHRLSRDTPASRLSLRSCLKYHDQQTFRTVDQRGQEPQYLLRVFESLPSLKAIEIRNVEGAWSERPTSHASTNG